MRHTKEEWILPVVPYVTGLCTMKREELKCGFERPITILAQNIFVPLPAIKFHNCWFDNVHHMLIMVPYSKWSASVERYLFKSSCNFLKLIFQDSTHKCNVYLHVTRPVEMHWRSKVGILSEVVLKLELLNKILLCKT